MVTFAIIVFYFQIISLICVEFNSQSQTTIDILTHVPPQSRNPNNIHNAFETEENAPISDDLNPPTLAPTMAKDDNETWETLKNNVHNFQEIIDAHVSTSDNSETNNNAVNEEKTYEISLNAPDFVYHSACGDHSQLCLNSKCCAMSGDTSQDATQYGCCPYENGICCPELKRCCPSGYKCLSKSTADRLTQIFGKSVAINFHCYVDISASFSFFTGLSNFKRKEIEEVIKQTI